MSVASKNLYALLGNDEEDGSENTAPVKTVTKTSTKTGKANADGTGPASSGGRGGFSTSEINTRDRFNPGGNRGKPTDEAPRGGPRGGRGARGRGGRGATHHRNADDRHTKNIVPGSEKQAAQSWGATEGAAELKDEQAGEAIAQSEQKDEQAEDAEADAEAQEPETEKMTLDAWNAKQAEDKAALNAGTATSTREANEGVPEELRQNWPDKEVERAAEENLYEPTVVDKRKHKPKKEKTVIQWDDSRPAADGQSGPRRGGERGERGGRGGERGDRRSGAPRGAPRGGAPRGGDGFSRGGPRGGRGGGAAPYKLNKDEFPGLPGQ